MQSYFQYLILLLSMIQSFRPNALNKEQFGQMVPATLIRYDIEGGFCGIDRFKEWEDHKQGLLDVEFHKFTGC